MKTQRTYLGLVVAIAMFGLACASGPAYQAPPVLPIPSAGTVTSPDGTATLRIVDGVRVLHLKGSHYQMGYNHGYLLAPALINMLTQYGFFVVSYFGLDYDEVLAKQKTFVWGEYEEELAGIAAGMRDALPPEQRIVTPPGKAPREVTIDDLKAMNTMGDWLTGLVACSSFSVWGEARADGSAILARNFDWLLDPGSVVMDHQVAIAYEPDYGPKWVNVTFIGEIGCVSGMNEYGATAVIHVSLDGYPPSDETGFVPGTLALRRVMEGLRADSRPAQADAALDAMPQMGQYAYHICFPAKGRADDAVAGVYEYDGDANGREGRSTWRRPSDNPVLPHNAMRDERWEFLSGIINVNHYLKRRSFIPLVFSSGRYVSIRRQLKAAMKDGNVDVEEGRRIMASVGFEPSWTMGPWITLHTVVMEPDARQVHVFLSQEGRAGYDGLRLDAPFAAFFE